MRVKLVADQCGMLREMNFDGGVWDKNTSAGAGFAHFDRRDMG